MAQTLDQQRAALAWGYANAGMKASFSKEYKGLAKGAPALIMNSGLMPTLAFYNGKGGAAHQLLDDLIRGLWQRLRNQPWQEGQGRAQFNDVMRTFQTGSSADYLRYTEESLELLKWIRQFVDAVNPGR